ncbi:hypothetical protein KY335_00885 [Candidatus Woesearchaeota archaeon]|nr:hypothetical protein [Candidatus Woesearchaeota archaeon]
MRRGAREHLSSCSVPDRYNRKGQVTIYIIIGIILVIVAAIVLYFVLTGPSKVTERAKERVVVGPVQLQPVSLFVEECGRRTSREALELMGRQGGWISLDDPQLTGGTVFDFTYDPTESDGVEFTPGGLKVPYWHYLKSPNTCINCLFSGKAPTGIQIQDMVDAYVEANVRECLMSLSEFVEQGYEIEELGAIDSQTTITASDVRVTLKYPLRVRRGELSYDFEGFYIIHDVNLRQMFTLGVDIVNAQAEGAFLEYNTMSLISAYARVEEDALPPIAEADMGMQKVFWVKFNVEQMVKQILATYVNLITIPDTRNFFPFGVEDGPGYEIRQGVHFGLVYGVLPEGRNYENLDVNMFYLNWPIYFDITPRDGQLIRPDEVSGSFQELIDIFTQSYRFYYDLAYPVVVEIRDPYAFNGDGYSMMFAMEANVRNNEPLLAAEERVPYLNELGAQGTSLFGNPNQRLSGDVIITAKDNSGNLLDNVMIRYYCGEDSTYIGSTDSKGKFVGKFPICDGGVLKTSKEGYYNYNYPLNTQYGQVYKFDAVLPKIVTKKVNIKVRPPAMVEEFDKFDYGSVNYQQYLQMLQQADELSNAFVYVTVARAPENAWEEPFSTTMIFDDETKENELPLVPGDYTIDARYFDNDGVVIPEETKKYGDQWVTLEEIEVKPAPLGGAALNSVLNNNWRVHKSDLDQNNKLQIFVIKTKKPTTHEELAYLGNIEVISEKKGSLIQPQWK